MFGGKELLGLAKPGSNAGDQPMGEGNFKQNVSRS